MSVRSIVTVLALVACNTQPEIAEPSKSAALSPPAAPHKTFGAPLGQSPRAKLADVLAAPDRFADKTVTVEGNVRSACSKKGCWMELAQAADAAAPGCRVTFKDYGFFVPTDSAGAQARVEAKVETKLVKPSMVTHLEEEGAKFAQKEPDGSAREVRLVATGVELWR
jgi:hypothetical protein